jgi:hypothetical protein
MEYWLGPYDFSILGSGSSDIFYLNQYPKGPVSIEGGLGNDQANFGQAQLGENHFSFTINSDLTVSISIASAYADYTLKSVEQLVFDNKTVRFYAEELIKKDFLGFSLTESLTTVRGVDSSGQQIIRIDGKWAASFIADAGALLAWHQDPSSPQRNTSLDGYTLNDILGAIERGLAGDDRMAFVQLVGLIADCKLLTNDQGQAFPYFDGNFI